MLGHQWTWDHRGPLECHVYWVSQVFVGLESFSWQTRFARRYVHQPKRETLVLGWVLDPLSGPPPIWVVVESSEVRIQIESDTQAIMTLNAEPGTVMTSCPNLWSHLEIQVSWPSKLRFQTNWLLRLLEQFLLVPNYYKDIKMLKHDSIQKAAIHSFSNMEIFL